MDFKKSTEASERNAPPNHYLIKIESFSSLFKAPTKKYISDSFEAGGYKWKLVLYPNGRKRNNRYISIYLELADISSLPTSWEINITFNLFIFNHLRDTYVIMQDGRIRRYHAMKTICGIDECMDLETFRNSQNGYLIKDTCIFGAEVFFVQNNFKKDLSSSANGTGKELVAQSNYKWECLSMMTEPITYSLNFEVNNFLGHQSYKSCAFGFYNWNVLLYPNGNKDVANCKGNFLSIYLTCFGPGVPQNTKFYVKFILRVKAKKDERHIQKEATALLAPSAIPSWGFHKFMPLATLKDSKYEYLVDNTCNIDAEVMLLGLVQVSDNSILKCIATSQDKCCSLCC